MKERPILYSTLMVESILDDQKKVTRRILKTQPLNKDIPIEYVYGWGWIQRKLLQPGKDEFEILQKFNCPYGEVGNLLWVREKFCYAPLTAETKPFYPDLSDYLFFAGTVESVRKTLRWKPSIHMPKVAARIWLKITDIRAERLQDITELESIKEGIKYLGTGEYGPEWFNYELPDQYLYLSKN